jgi:hypothetical protein
VLAVLKWLNAQGKLPELPAQVQPTRIALPAKWRFADVLFDYAAVDRSLAPGRFELSERDAPPAGSPAKTHKFRLAAGVVYTLDVKSLDFVPAFHVENSTGQILARNEPNERLLASRLTFSSMQDDIYRVVVTAQPPRRTGVYSLTIQKAVDAQKNVQGQLNSTDPVIRMQDRNQTIDSHHKVHQVNLTAAAFYSIDLRSRAIDSFLRLENDQGTLLAENDDIDPPNLDSRIVYQPASDGSYRVVATSFQPRQTGAYTLSIRRHENVYPSRDFGLEGDAQSIADPQAQQPPVPPPPPPPPPPPSGGVSVKMIVAGVVVAIILIGVIVYLFARLSSA